MMMDASALPIPKATFDMMMKKVTLMLLAGLGWDLVRRRRRRR